MRLLQTGQVTDQICCCDSSSLSIERIFRLPVGSLRCQLFWGECPQIPNRIKAQGKNSPLSYFHCKWVKVRATLLLKLPFFGFSWPLTSSNLFSSSCFLSKFSSSFGFDGFLAARETEVNVKANQKAILMCFLEYHVATYPAFFVSSSNRLLHISLVLWVLKHLKFQSLFLSHQG